MSRPNISEVFLLNELKLISKLLCLHLLDVDKAVVQTSLSLFSFKSTAKLIEKIDQCHRQHNAVKNKPFFSVSGYDKISLTMLNFEHGRTSTKLESEIKVLLKELGGFGSTVLKKSRYLDDIVKYGVPSLP